MSTFEPAVILFVLKNLKTVKSERQAFEEKWNTSVKDRVNLWKKCRGSHSATSDAQLEWESCVVEYVNFVHGQTRIHGNTNKAAQPKPLPKEIPLLGPRFIPPTYQQIERRHAAPIIEPESAYLKPLHIVHPFYYPRLARCPQCTSVEVIWEGWTTTGSRDVHGVHEDEKALGFQMRCKKCEQLGTAKGHRFCVATTNPSFWIKWEHWELPNGIPHFFKRCAVTRELFNLIIELRPSVTSGGLAENIKQLHLLNYHKKMFDYLESFQSLPNTSGRLVPLRLRDFSGPWDKQGYNEHTISDDTITEVYLEFCDKSRKDESDEYLRTLTGRCISADGTFKISKKGTVSDSMGKRSKLLKGGIVNCVNEGSETLSWRFSHTQSNAEFGELLQGLRRRYDALVEQYPELVVADNCCHVRSEISKSFPDAQTVLDLWHLVKRYTATVLRGVHNPYQRAVAKDIVDAIVEKRADSETPAIYRPQTEQVERLQAAYEKWAKVDGVWSAAASKVHADQLQHVKNGCLARTRNDIRSDGSRIEGSHKHWNHLQRSFSSGIVVMRALSHDFVLRRNIRIGFAACDGRPFLKSSHGSHHTRLITRIASIWNEMLCKKQTAGLVARPELKLVDSGEEFGLVSSDTAATFGGLFEVKKEEPTDELLDLTLENADEAEHILRDLNIDPILLQAPPSTTPTTTSHWQHSQPMPIGPALPPSTTPTTASRSSLTTPIGPTLPPSTSPTTTSCSSLMPSQGSSKRKAAPEVDTSTTHKRSRFEATANSQDHDMNQVEFVQFTPPTNHVTSNSTPACDPLSSPPISESYTSSSNSATVSQNDAHSGTDIRTFFTRSQKAIGQGHSSNPTPKRQPARTPAPTVESLTQSLPAPALSQLTRSQLIFSISTGINAQALSIALNEEYYLFMNMREERGWVSYAMTSHKWVIATNDFNTRLTALNSAKHLPTIPKHPRALMEFLAQIEEQVAARIARNDFISKTSGTDIFWKRHCFAVSLVKETGTNANNMLTRKTAVCKRCRTVMYPGGNDNHKKGYCADGAPQKSSNNDSLPEWPQPQGIFEKGALFHPITFLKVLREVYERVVVCGVDGSDLPLEYEAFAKMLNRRTVVDGEGNILFKLFDLNVPPSTPDSLVVMHHNFRHLRLDCLRDN